MAAVWIAIANKLLLVRQDALPGEPFPLGHRESIQIN